MGSGERAPGALGSAALLSYAALMWLAFHAWVLIYEEPTLRARFGASYDE